MACGIGLGILLVCLAQAERARCLWTSAAQSSNDNRHVGFLDQDGRPRGLGGSPQNQVRQVLVSPRPFQSRGSSIAPAVQRGSGPRLSTRDYTQTSFQPAQNSAGPMQSSLVSNLSYKAHLPFTAVSRNQQGPGEKSRTGSAQQARLAAVQPRPRSAASMFGPTGSSSSGLASFPSAAQEPSSVGAKIPSSYNQMGSVLFSPVGASPRGSRVQMQTYAHAPAKRASRRRSKAHRSPQTGTGRPGSAGIPKFMIPAQGPLGFKVPGSRPGGSGPATVHNIPQHLGGSPIRRFKDPAEQVRTQKPVQVLAPPRQQLAVYKPQRPGARQDSKWTRVQLQHGS